MKRFFCLVVCLLLGNVFAADGPDLEVVHRIKQEAFKRSQVMKIMFQMTDVYGPRLTNSPGMDAAAVWAVGQANEWGLENAALETWEPFGRGWSTSRFTAHLLEPRYAPLIGVPLAWSPGTDGPIMGSPIFAPLKDKNDHEDRVAELERYMEEWRGKLGGKMLLIEEPRHLTPGTEAPLKRFDGSELSDRAKAPDPVEPIEIDPENIVLPDNDYERKRFWSHAPRWATKGFGERRRELRNRLNEFLVQEGVALVIRPPWRGENGTLFPGGGGSRRMEDPLPPPSISLTAEHYNRVVRLVRHEELATLEVEVEAQMHTDDLAGANVVAEIRGATRPDEIVMIGAHYDDVVYATGATDNAAGCAVMMEVMRILKALELPLDRTVRMVLWTGEEQGLLGSKAYVKEHFGDPRTMELTAEQEKVSAYYNLDNGTGKIRGVYLQGNDMVRPIFSSWLGPFSDHGASTLTIRNTGGTDHLSFDAVGIPGFQFIQDPVEYWSITHHSNMDVYDRIVPADLMQAAAIIATIVYQTANREEKIPRKPLPEPWPENLQHLEN
jgi:carboxypeptidase Q